jgi:hypothetical protein
MTSPSVMFVHLGPAIPSWLGWALKQVRLFNACPVHVVTSREALAGFAFESALGIATHAIEDLGISEKQRRFRQISPFDKDYRGGFWSFTTERFFALESAMAALNLEHVVHLENDVMLYAGVDALTPHFERFYPGIAATFDNDARCVPGFLYIRNLAAIGRLTAFILDVLPRLRPEQRARTNDMALLGAFRSQGEAAIGALPIVPPDYPHPLRSPMGHIPRDPKLYSRHFDIFKTVFDAAGFGQYLGGIDPRNDPRPSHGFINESCVANAHALRTRMIDDPQCGRIPVIETAGGVHRVANLHIHSKSLQRFLSR